MNTQPASQPATGDPTDLTDSVAQALRAIPGVTMTSVAVVEGGVAVEFTDTAGYSYQGQVVPGFREVTGEHPSAQFCTVTVFDDVDGDGRVNPAEQVAWLADTARRSLSAMAGVHAWERVSRGRELPTDGAFTVTRDPDGTVTAELLVSCDGFDATATHTRRRGGPASLGFAMTDDSPYVPPHLRAVVAAGLPVVVAAQAGYTVHGLARQIDAAAFAWEIVQPTPRTNGS